MAPTRRHHVSKSHRSSIPGAARRFLQKPPVTAGPVPTPAPTAAVVPPSPPAAQAPITPAAAVPEVAATLPPKTSSTPAAAAEARQPRMMNPRALGPRKAAPVVEPQPIPAATAEATPVVPVSQTVAIPEVPPVHAAPVTTQAPLTVPATSPAPAASAAVAATPARTRSKMKMKKKRDKAEALQQQQPQQVPLPSAQASSTFTATAVPLEKTKTELPPAAEPAVPTPASVRPVISKPPPRRFFVGLEEPAPASVLSQEQQQQQPEPVEAKMGTTAAIESTKRALVEGTAVAAVPPADTPSITTPSTTAVLEEAAVPHPAAPSAGSTLKRTKRGRKEAQKTSVNTATVTAAAATEPQSAALPQEAMVETATAAVALQNAPPPATPIGTSYATQAQPRHRIMMARAHKLKKAVPAAAKVEPAVAGAHTLAAEEVSAAVAPEPALGVAAEAAATATAPTLVAAVAEELAVEASNVTVDTVTATGTTTTTPAPVRRGTISKIPKKRRTFFTDLQPPSQPVAASQGETTIEAEVPAEEPTVHAVAEEAGPPRVVKEVAPTATAPELVQAKLSVEAPGAVDSTPTSAPVADHKRRRTMALRSKPKTKRTFFEGLQSPSEAPIQAAEASTVALESQADSAAVLKEATKVEVEQPAKTQETETEAVREVPTATRRRATMSLAANRKKNKFFTELDLLAAEPVSEAVAAPLQEAETTEATSVTEKAAQAEPATVVETDAEHLTAAADEAMMKAVEEELLAEQATAEAAEGVAPEAVEFAPVVPEPAHVQAEVEPQPEAVSEEIKAVNAAVEELAGVFEEPEATEAPAVTAEQTAKVKVPTPMKRKVSMRARRRVRTSQQAVVEEQAPQVAVEAQPIQAVVEEPKTEAAPEVAVEPGVEAAEPEPVLGAAIEDEPAAVAEAEPVAAPEAATLEVVEEDPVAVEEVVGEPAPVAGAEIIATSPAAAVSSSVAQSVSRRAQRASLQRKLRKLSKAPPVAESAADAVTDAAGQTKGSVEAVPTEATVELTTTTTREAPTVAAVEAEVIGTTQEIPQEPEAVSEPVQEEMPLQLRRLSAKRKIKQHSKLAAARRQKSAGEGHSSSSAQQQQQEVTAETQTESAPLPVSRQAAAKNLTNSRADDVPIIRHGAVAPEMTKVPQSMEERILTFPNGKISLEAFNETEMVVRRASLDEPWDIGLRFDWNARTLAIGSLPHLHASDPRMAHPYMRLFQSKPVWFLQEVNGASGSNLKAVMDAMKNTILAKFVFKRV